MKLTQYVIKLPLKQMSKPNFDELWSSFMEANIDCVTDLEHIIKGSETQYVTPLILFKTVSERNLANAILSLSK